MGNRKSFEIRRSPIYSGKEPQAETNSWIDRSLAKIMSSGRYLFHLTATFLRLLWFTGKRTSGDISGMTRPKLGV